MLQPIKPPAIPTLPKNKVTVAVHLRKGGGFDPKLKSQQYYDSKKYGITLTKFDVDTHAHALDTALESISIFSPSHCSNKKCGDEIWPDRFPPEQYYADQIQKLSELLNDPPTYVYVFTDDKKPLDLLERLKKQVNKPNIEFACRTEQNRHNMNVIYDYFFMGQFDCLIRSGSGFAYAAQLLGNHKIIIYPIHLKWEQPDILLVDNVGIILREYNSLLSLQ